MAKDLSEQASDDVGEVVHNLGRVIRAIDLYRQGVAAQLRISLSELIALGDLAEPGTLRAGDLGQRLGLTSGSVTALLDRLEARGYVERSRPPSDRRSVWVGLTPAGDALVTRMFGSVESAIRDVARSGESPGLAQLAHCLEQLGNALHEMAADLPPITLDRAVAARGKDGRQSGVGAT